MIHQCTVADLCKDTLNVVYPLHCVVKADERWVLIANQQRDRHGSVELTAMRNTQSTVMLSAAGNKDIAQQGDQEQDFVATGDIASGVRNDSWECDRHESSRGKAEGVARQSFCFQLCLE